MNPNPEELEAVTGAEAAIVAKMKARFVDAFVADQVFRGQLSVWVEPRAVVEALQFLKNDPETLYAFLTDITAVDRLDHRLKGEPRFEVVYILYSPTFNRTSSSSSSTDRSGWSRS